MKTFKEYLKEERVAEWPPKGVTYPPKTKEDVAAMKPHIDRVVAMAKKLHTRYQQRNPRSWVNIIMHGNKFGKYNPSGVQEKPIRSLISRSVHYNDNPKKRPEPVQITVPLKSLKPTQPGIDPDRPMPGNSDLLEFNLRNYLENPNKARTPNVDTYGPEDENGKRNIGDGHNRIDALLTLQAVGVLSPDHEIVVNHYEKGN